MQQISCSLKQFASEFVLLMPQNLKMLGTSNFIVIFIVCVVLKCGGKVLSKTDETKHASVLQNCCFST